MRRVIDIATVVGAAGAILVEKYRPIRPEEWQRVADVAYGQGRRMNKRAEEIRAELGLSRRG